MDKLHISAILTMERTLVPMEQEAGWSLEPVWAILENRNPLPGFEPRTIRPIATPYTDYILLAHCTLCHTKTNCNLFLIPPTNAHKCLLQ